MSGVASVQSRLRYSLQLGWQALTRGLCVLGELWRYVPRSRLLLWGACALLLAAWGCERQARLRQTTESQQLRKQAATTIAVLEAQAAAAVRAANQRHAQMIHDLQAKRTKLEEQARVLAAQLRSRQTEERAQAAQVAALSTPELARRVGAAIGERELETRSRELSAAEPPASGLGSSSPTPDSPFPTPALTLSEPELRQLAAALVERDGCHAQRLVVEAQFANCRAQAAVDSAIIQQQTDSLAQLNQALAAKDALAARRDALHQAELKAARGGRLARLARAVRWVAVGIVIGAVIR